MTTEPLILKRASASRLSGEWDDDDYDVLSDGVVVGRIFKAAASPVGTPWLWTLAYGQHEDRSPMHGYEATREAAMAARDQARRLPRHRPQGRRSQRSSQGRGLVATGVVAQDEEPILPLQRRARRKRIGTRPWIYWNAFQARGAAPVKRFSRSFST